MIKQILLISWVIYSRSITASEQIDKTHSVAQSVAQHSSNLLNREMHLYGTITNTPKKLPTITKTETALNILATRLAYYQGSTADPSRLRSMIFLKYLNYNDALTPVKQALNKLEHLKQDSPPATVQTAINQAVAAGLTFGIRYACHYAAEEPDYFTLPQEILTKLEIAGCPRSHLAPDLVPMSDQAETKSDC